MAAFLGCRFRICVFHVRKKPEKLRVRRKEAQDETAYGTFVTLNCGSLRSAASIQVTSMRGRGRAQMKIAKTLAIALILVTTPYIASAQQSAAAETSAQPVPLSLEQVVTNLEQRNAQRAAALEAFEGKRIYRMEYRGFPSDKDAEMIVKVSFHAPNSKEFTVVSETGSKFIIERVFRKLLEGEQEAASRDSHHDTALTRQNYDFELAGYEPNPDGGQYVLNLVPKTRNKFLYRGKV